MIELFTQPYNYAICKMKKRAFPGIVVQGDSFTALSLLLVRAYDFINNPPDDEDERVGMLLDLEYEIRKHAGVLNTYADTCSANGYNLPFNKEILGALSDKTFTEFSDD